jgi:hypothetical protein
MKKLLYSIILSFILLFINSCGGGSGSSSDNKDSSSSKSSFTTESSSSTQSSIEIEVSGRYAINQAANTMYCSDGSSVYIPESSTIITINQNNNVISSPIANNVEVIDFSSMTGSVSNDGSFNISGWVTKYINGSTNIAKDIFTLSGNFEEYGWYGIYEEKIEVSNDSCLLRTTFYGIKNPPETSTSSQSSYASSSFHSNSSSSVSTVSDYPVGGIFINGTYKANISFSDFNIYEETITGDIIKTMNCSNIVYFQDALLKINGLSRQLIFKDYSNTSCTVENIYSKSTSTIGKYNVNISREADNWYLDTLSNKYIKTSNCYEYVFYEDATLDMTLSTHGTIIFSDYLNTECTVEGVFNRLLLP